MSTRFFAIIGPLEVYHAKNEKSSISTVSILDHNYSAEQFAAALKLASEWFANVAQGRIDPAPLFRKGAVPR